MDHGEKCKRTFVLFPLKNSSISCNCFVVVKLAVHIWTTVLSMVRPGGSFFSSTAQFSFIQAQSASMPAACVRRAAMGR